MALITLEEAKAYLRVDSGDDDALIDSLLASCRILCKDVGRVSDEAWELVNTPSGDDNAEIISLRAILRVAILYSLGYLYEHRDKANHHDMVLTLRNLLFAVREGIL